MYVPWSDAVRAMKFVDVLRSDSAGPTSRGGRRKQRELALLRPALPYFEASLPNRPTNAVTSTMSQIPKCVIRASSRPVDERSRGAAGQNLSTSAGKFIPAPRKVFTLSHIFHGTLLHAGRLDSVLMVVSRPREAA
ncbi:hypothetical protein KM043_011674 [Ampulex compressa]|nr:hypothetical protein KM043_011674 [Ampulex compressa]